MFENIFLIRHAAFDQGSIFPNERGNLQLETLNKKIKKSKLKFDTIISSSGPLSIYTAKKIIEANSLDNRLLIDDTFLKKKTEVKNFSNILNKLKKFKSPTLIVTNGEFIFNFLEFLKSENMIDKNPITLARGECYFVQFIKNKVLLEIY